MCLIRHALRSTNTGDPLPIRNAATPAHLCTPFTSNGGILIRAISWDGHYNQAGTPGSAHSPLYTSWFFRKKS